MSTTTVLLRSEIDSKLQILLSEVQEKVDGLLNCQLSFLYGNNPIQANPSDILRVVSEIVSDDPGNQTLKNLLINTIVTSENLWAGSGFMSLLVLLEANKVLQKNRLLNNRVDYNFAKLNREVSSQSRRVSSTDIIKSLSGISSSSYELELVKETLRITGGAANANLVDKVGINTSIISHSGYHIKVSPNELFWSASGSSVISLYSSKIICVDGIVESVSEIHNITDQSFRTGQSVVIFARGFNDDVTNTLAVNHGKGMLNVIPVVVPYDLKGVNQLVDIAVCCCTDVVSSLKGELISTIEWDDLSTIDRIKLNSNRIIIENKQAQRSVNRHQQQVQKKLNRLSNTDVLRETEEQTQANRKLVEEQTEILQERILSLSSTGVQIVLGREHGSSRGIRKDRVQTLLRSYSQGSKYGLINLEKVNPVGLNIIAKSVLGILLEHNITNVSPPAILCAFKVGMANAKMMQKIGAWLTIDER